MEENLLHLEAEFAQQQNYTVGHVLFNAYYQEGLGCQKEENKDEAFSFWKKAYLLAKEFRRKGDPVARADQIRACFATSALFIEQRRFGKAQDLLEEALLLAQEWVACEPRIASYEALGAAYDHSGTLAMQAGYPQDAIEFYESAVQTAERARAVCDDVQQRHSHALYLTHLADALRTQRQTDRALAVYQDALSIIGEEVSDDTLPEYRHCVANLYLQSGMLLESFSRRDEAQKYYESCIAIMDRLLQTGDSVEWVSSCAKGNFLLSQLMQAKVGTFAASRYLMRALQLTTQNADRSKAPAVLHDWGVALCAWAQWMGDRPKAQEAYRVFCELCQRYPQNSFYANKKQYAYRLLMQLG